MFEGERPPLEKPLEVQLRTGSLRPRRDFEIPDSVRVDADGRFDIGNIIGERIVTVQGLMPQWEVKEVRRGGRVLPDGRLTLTAGQVVDDIEIVIARRP